MVSCYSYGCNHRSGRDNCQLFRFPVKRYSRNRWVNLCRRRTDRKLTQNDRLCSCHFKDGIKGNGPGIFPYMKHQYEDPEPKKRRKIAVSATPDRKTFKTTICIQKPPIHYNVCHDHMYSHPTPSECAKKRQLLVGTIKEMDAQILQLGKKVELLSNAYSRMSVNHIKDDEEKMLWYTSLTYKQFQLLMSVLECMQPLKYHTGWRVTTLPLEDQLLIALMKLKQRCHFIDLSVRFCVSQAIISNIVHTLINALHDMFQDVTPYDIHLPDQLKESVDNSYVSFRIPNDSPTADDEVYDCS